MIRKRKPTLKLDDIPAVLFDGNKVLLKLRENPEHAKRTFSINVCDVLDAVVAIMRREKP